MDELKQPDIQDITSEIQETTTHDEGGGSHSNPILVRRMFEVFCISIHRDRSFESTNSYPKTYKLESVYDGNPCHIYGLVRVFSEDGHTSIDIYHREKDNFEVVEFGGFLSITNSHVISPTYLRVVVYLYDMAHDAEIANGFFDLDYCYEYAYDVLKVETVDGLHGFASVRHSTFQHAVVANVERVVLNKIVESESDAGNSMLRTVRARLERTYSTSDDYRIYKDECGVRIFPSSSGDPLEEFPSAILFNNRHGSEPFDFGVPVKLFRSSIVVPSFCSLVISFRDNADRKVVEDISFDVMDGGLIEMSSTGQCCELVLEGEWRQGYASEPIQLVLSNKQSSSNIVSAMPKAFPCVEIFSVLVWLDDADMDISGTATMMDSSRDPFHIFDSQETWYWLRGTPLPIVGPPWSFDIEPFKFQIQIQDDANHFVTKGSFEWNIGNDYDGSMSVYDKLLSSVVRGEVGYAAVHYSMITYGIQAKISVLIRSQSSCNFSVEVSGNITAEYDGYNYPTLYDLMYYRSTLFSMPPTEYVQVDLTNEWIELPMAKSVMSVPLDDLLVLDVNLMVLSPGRDDKGNIIESKKISEVVKERLKFGGDVDAYRFQRNKYSIRVTVYLSDVRNSQP